MSDEKIKMKRHGVTIFVKPQDVAEKRTQGFVEVVNAPVAQSAVQEEPPLPEPVAPSAKKSKG